jgi:WD40 repeat protein
LHQDFAGALYQRWDPDSMRPTAAVALPGLVSTWASSPDGRLVAAGNSLEARDKPTVRVFDVQSGSLLYSFNELDDFVTGVFPGRVLVPGSLVFSADSQHLVGVTNDPGAAAIWDLKTGIARPILTNGALIADSGNNGEVVVTGENFRLTVFDGATLETRYELAGRPYAAVNAHFHPSKPVLVSSGPCGQFEETAGKVLRHSMQLWDLERKVEIGTGLPLLCVRWSPDGERFVGMDSNSIQIWSTDWEQWKRAACEAAGRNLTDDEWRTYVSKTEPRRDTCA